MIWLFFLCILNVRSDLVSDVNNKHPGWVAKSILTDIDYREDILPEAQAQFNVIPLKTKNGSLPVEYDWRKQIIKCKSNIVDGGSCASSWALTPAKIMNYRACQNGKNISYSSIRILSCCKSCGAGCYGGYPWRAFNYLMNEGVPSDKCQPFSINNTPIRALTPFCRSKYCNANLTYNQNKVKIVYKVSDIKNEIYQRGPVVSYMNLYRDFFYYSSGIYKHIAGPKMGRLSVILLGWGNEKGIQFWIGENTWGKKWGEEGYFRIIRGSKQANVEQYVFAAY